jgi:hypothetical protein
MIKQLLFFGNKIKGFLITGFHIHDLIDFFVQLWSILEWMVMGTTLLWIPLLKLASLMFVHFGIRLPFGLPLKNSAMVLRTIYWITVLATVLNMLVKLANGYDAIKLLALASGYAFLLMMDYIETDDMVKKINAQKVNR